MDWTAMTAGEAEALAAGLLAGERLWKQEQYELNWNGAVAGAGGYCISSGLASIDWREVEPLPEYERWSNEPGYLSIAF